jgi:hypothetical protein
MNVRSAAGIANIPTSNNVVTYAQVRDAIVERLGGPFDYSSFHQEVRAIGHELEQVTREFKHSQSQAAIPEQKMKAVDKVPPYNFALPDFEGQSVFKVDTIFGGQPLKPGKVSFDKPKYLSEIDGKEPDYLLTCDLRELEQAAAARVELAPTTSI